MAHRGKLNLLTGLLGVSPAALFHKIDGYSEFAATETCNGDVLLHMSNSTEVDVNGHRLRVTMLPCPSHLEAVVPVAMGKTRARQLSWGPEGYTSASDKVLCVQIHGDAAIAAQGVVMETLSLANVPHYSVGGSVHFVTNNRLGFTTPEYHGRSSQYCSDVVKAIGCPVVHVNGDYPEDVMRSCDLAVQYRNMFKKDVIVDMLCYRKRGHNEGDEPLFTQPVMYHRVMAHPGTPSSYTSRTLDTSTAAEVAQEVSDYRQSLDEQLAVAADYQPPPRMLQKQWEGLSRATPTLTTWDTGCSLELLKYVGAKSVAIPEGKTVHQRLMKAHVQERCNAIAMGTKLNWATAEALAIGTLLCQGFNVRLSGQDVGRGTFSHRHVMLVDQVTDEAFVPLNSMDHQSSFLEVASSPLSEEAVIGFEYGFSIDNPTHLVIWEAQFGDFFNGAQIMFDNFISSGEGTESFLKRSVLAVLNDESFMIKSEPAFCVRRTAQVLLEWMKKPGNMVAAGEFEQKLITSLESCFKSMSSLKRSREGMWSAYHQLRTSKEYLLMWRSLLDECCVTEKSAMFCQCVGDYMIKHLAKQLHPLPEISDSKEVSFTYEEINAIRYTAGYIPRALKKQLSKSAHHLKKDLEVCLNELVADQDEYYDESQDWINSVNRGGLVKVRNDTYELFLELEKELRKHLSTVKPIKLSAEVKKALVDNPSVQFLWYIISADWDEECSATLLEMVVCEWVKIRGFSFASAWIEQYKVDRKKTLQKSKGIRKQLLPQCKKAKLQQE